MTTKVDSPSETAKSPESQTQPSHEAEGVVAYAVFMPDGYMVKFSIEDSEYLSWMKYTKGAPSSAHDQLIAQGYTCRKVSIAEVGE